MRLPQYLFSITGFTIVGLFLATSVNAEVYKCTFIDNTTRQNKVIYSDAPCAKSEKQTVTAIPLKSPLTVPVQTLQTAQASQQLAQDNALDAALTRAVLNREFKLAKSLAATKEHWRLIAIAEDEAALQPVISANDQALALREAECAQAKDNFDMVSRTSWRDRELVAAKKSIMYVACDVTEPEQSQPVYVGRTFGGLYSGRWYPNHVMPHQHRPHKGVDHTYPIDHHYHGRIPRGGSASLSYKSKHFSINADSTNVR